MINIEEVSLISNSDQLISTIDISEISTYTNDINKYFIKRQFSTSLQILQLFMYYYNWACIFKYKFYIVSTFYGHGHAVITDT